MANWAEIPDLYRQPSGKHYFNSASFGLISKSGVDEAHDFNENLHHLGSKHAEDFFSNGIMEVRESVARFTDASLKEIALIPNFSFGLTAILTSIQKLKRVLLFRGDYPSLTLPFELNDFEVYWIESVDGFSIDLNTVEQIIKRYNIEILAISHVQYLTGFKIDINELHFLCDKYHVLFILDGTQSLGAIPFSFKPSGVNILITSNYKWMNAGYGTGIMCIDPETFQQYPPKIGGYNSFRYINDKWQYQQSIRSYEPGHPNMSGLLMLKDAIDHKIELEQQRIAKHNFELLQFFTQNMDKSKHRLVGPTSNINRSSITCIYGDENLERYLMNHDIVVKLREGMIRIGVHFYNTKSDIKHLLNCLEEYDNR